MDDIILEAAGSDRSHVSVAPFDGGDPLVTVSFPPKRPLRTRIPAKYLFASDMLRIVLGDLVRMAKNR
jgi:hypothetical protein